MSGDQYLLLLPLGVDRNRFLLQHGRPMQDLGYVAYPWSPAINAYPLRLKYKVWLELRKMSPQAWNLDHLIPTVSSFGIVLDHTPLNNVHSLERMMVAVAVTDLSKVPRAILLWVRGLARSIEILVHGWVEEPLPLMQPLDPTPDQAFFYEVRNRTSHTGVLSTMVPTLASVQGNQCSTKGNEGLFSHL